MKVSEIAKMKGITFEEVLRCFLDDYSQEDAERFFLSDWKKAQATIACMKPLCYLFSRKYV